jgi:hypothetical protein
MEEVNSGCGEERCGGEVAAAIGFAAWIEAGGWGERPRAKK